MLLPWLRSVRAELPAPRIAAVPGAGTKPPLGRAAASNRRDISVNATAICKCSFPWAPHLLHDSYLLNILTRFPPFTDKLLSRGRLGARLSQGLGAAKLHLQKPPGVQGGTGTRWHTVLCQEEVRGSIQTAAGGDTSGVQEAAALCAELGFNLAKSLGKPLKQLRGKQQ